MSTTLLLLLSGALIAAGVGMIWRDVHKRRRDTFVVQRDDARRWPPMIRTSRSPPWRAPPAARAPTPVTRGRARCPRAPTAADAAARWAALQPVLGDAVQQVNAVLAGAGVALGAPGEPSWSMYRRYGAYRRVLVGGESLAWLRLELDADGLLHAGVKAHKDDLAASSTPMPAWRRRA